MAGAQSPRRSIEDHCDKRPSSTSIRHPHEASVLLNDCSGLQQGKVVGEGEACKHNWRVALPPLTIWGTIEGPHRGPAADVTRRTEQGIISHA